jgi:hypothetical protein
MVHEEKNAPATWTNHHIFAIGRNTLRFNFEHNCFAAPGTYASPTGLGKFVFSL